jgi:hypothetical protein
MKPTDCKEKIFVLFLCTFLLTREIVIQIVERPFIRPAVLRINTSQTAEETFIFSIPHTVNAEKSLQ